MRIPVRAGTTAIVAGLVLGAQAPSAFADSSTDRLERWRGKWGAKQTHWHINGVHPVLARYMDTLLPPGKSAGAAVIFPLCGAAVDLGNLAKEGFEVFGVEGVPEAVDSLMGAFGYELPPVSAVVMDGGGMMELTMRSAVDKSSANQPSIHAIQTDFLRLTPHALSSLSTRVRPTPPSFQAAFDRGSLVAIQPSDRPQYVRTLSNLMAPGGRILLVSVEHRPFSDGRLGPPFQLTEGDIKSLFEPLGFSVTLLHREDRMPIESVWKKRGLSHFNETAYLVTKGL